MSNIREIIRLHIKETSVYLNSIGVAMKLASITLGEWQRDPSNAIAIPHRKTVTPAITKN